MMRRFLVPALAACAAVLPARAAEGAQLESGSWIEHPPDLPIEGHGLALLGNFLYRMGGGGIPSTNALRRLDLSTGAWSTLEPMPAAGKWFGTAVVGGTIYGIGIATGTTTSIFAYDVAGNSWTGVGTLPTARWGVATAVHDGKIYVVGGVLLSALSGDRSVTRFDPAAPPESRFTAMRPLPMGTMMGSAGVIGDRLYYAGGARSLIYGGAVDIVRSMDLDPESDSYNTWREEGSLPEGRFQAATFTVNGRFFVVAGSSWDYSGPDETVEPDPEAPPPPPSPWVNSDTVFEYDPEFRAWTTHDPLPGGPRKQAAGCSSFGRGFVSGGAGGATALGLVHEYNLPPNAPRNLSQRKAGGAELPEGSKVTEGSTMEFRATVTDPSFGDLVRLELELVGSDGHAAQFRSELGPQGLHVVQVVDTPSGSWTWSCRAIDGHGAGSAWVSFSDGDAGTPSDLDFQVEASGGGGGGGGGAGGCSAAPLAGPFIAFLLAAGLSAFPRRIS